MSPSKKEQYDMPTKKTNTTQLADELVRKSLRKRSRELVGRPREPRPQAAGGFRVRQLMTPLDVQKRLEVSESWLKRSDIPFHKLGRLRRYDAAVVEAYLDARAV
jgi:hypothetical protein